MTEDAEYRRNVAEETSCSSEILLNDRFGIII